MSTATAQRPTTTDTDRDGIDVYCPEAQAWSRTRHLFCESCGATNHDLV